MDPRQGPLTFTNAIHHTVYPSISPDNPSISAKEKVVLVTGAGKGIGKSVALAFATAGAIAIVITGRHRQTLDETKGEIEKLGVKAAAFAADVVDEKAIQNAFTQSMQMFGRIDIVVSNAGYLSTHVPVSESPLDDYWRGYEVNVKGGIIVTQAFLKVAAPGATFINISSGAAHLPSIPGYSGYSSSKIAFAKIIEYVQSENPNLRLFNLQPGAIETDMSRKGGNIPTTDDIALPGGFCVWLASKKSDFLKGRLIWSNWDVDELEAMADEIQKDTLLTIALRGVEVGTFSVIE